MSAAAMHGGRVRRRHGRRSGEGEGAGVGGGHGGLSGVCGGRDDGAEGVGGGCDGGDGAHRGVRGGQLRVWHDLHRCAGGSLERLLCVEDGGQRCQGFMVGSMVRPLGRRRAEGVEGSAGCLGGGGWGQRRQWG